MKLDKHEKITLGIGAALLAALYFWTRNKNANSPLSFNLPQINSTVPHYLTYNQNPVFYNGPDLSLPTLAQPSGCQTCSLFS